MIVSNFYIEPADYVKDYDDLRSIRELVFIVEQQIPADVEFDELDRRCHHVLARDLQGRPIGTGRLAMHGNIGRMAVLPEWRRQNVGQSILHALIDQASRLGLTKVTANAQLAALGFYEKYGFSNEGEEFKEAGIPHQPMQLILKSKHLSKPKKTVSTVRPPSVKAVKINALETVIAATVKLIMQSRRRFCFFSSDLELILYGQKEVVEALKQLALRNGTVQAIFQNCDSVRKQSHPLLDLAQRLPSHFEFRMAEEEEDRHYLSAFSVDDRDGYLFRPINNRFEGFWSPVLPARHRKLTEQFESVWQRSRPYTEFRALGL